MGNWRVVSLGRFDEWFDDLAATALHPFPIAGARHSAFLNWRFADPRAGTFRLRAAVDGERILGFVVTTFVEGRAHIGDLLVKLGRNDVLDGLLRDAIESAREDGT
jgi:hypothetical protein